MSTNAKLCNMCGSGCNDEKCIICGRPFAKTMAYLCSMCGIGSKGDHCVKCGGAFARIQAHLCQTCAVKYKDKCIKCGRHIF